MSQATELIAKQMAAGSANARVWADILYNVKLYGAKGDGVTDDTAAIQATIDYAISVGGKAIFFPHGTYKVTALTNLSSVVLFGDNASFTGISDTINQIGSPVSNLAINIKDYGAKGDGINDDTAAILAAIDVCYASGGGTVVIPSGTYKTTATIVVKTNVHLEVLKGARIKPLGNHNVIQVRNNAKLTGAVIDCTGTYNYSGSAIFLDGIDKFGTPLTPAHIENVDFASTIIDDISIVNNTYTGKAIEFYCSAGDKFIMFVSTSNLNIVGFEYGIHLHCDAHDGTLGSTFINGNNFDNIIIGGCVYGIYLDGSLIPYEVAGNIFTNFQYQTFYWFTKRALYINARFTRIDGILWDGATADVPTIMVEIETTAINTIVKTNIGSINYDTILDKGYNTKIIGDTDDFYNVQNPSIVNGLTMNGDQDDYLAYSWRRYGITSNIVPTGGSLFNMFDPIGGFTSQWSNPASPIIIDIDLTSEPILGMQFIGVAFAYTQVAKYVKFEYQVGANPYVTLFERKQNRQTYVTFGIENRVENVSKLRITLDQPNISGSISVARIYAQDSFQTGRVWLSKLGGKVYDHIEFHYTGYGPVVRSPNNTRYVLGVNDAGVVTATLA